MQNRLFLLSLYTMVINTALIPINGSMAAVFGYITIICFWLYPVVCSIEEHSFRLKGLTFGLILCCICSMMMSISCFSLNGSIDIFTAIINFIVFYWILTYKNNQRVTISLDDIARMNYLLCAILLLYGYGPFSFKYMEVDLYGNKIFSMGLGNPNSVSVYVIFAIMVLLIQIVDMQSIIHRVINIGIICLLFYLLLLLSSRTVLVCVLFLLVGYVIGKKSDKIKYYLLAILAWPIIMVAVQLYIGKSKSAILLLGKALNTGRSEMYSTFLNDVENQPFSFVFGMVFKYGFTNMHNAPLTIVANVGIIGLIVYLVIWYKHIKLLNEICINATQRIAIYSILVFIIQSSSESLAMIGTIPYAIMVIIIDKIARGEITRSTREIKKSRRSTMVP